MVAKVSACLQFADKIVRFDLPQSSSLAILVYMKAEDGQTHVGLKNLQALLISITRAKLYVDIPEDLPLWRAR
jgi:hypothetical protein